MKVTGLLLVTLGLVACAQATLKEYSLGCTKEEMGIRWPSYVSHSEYYVCPRVGGKQMTVSCKAGEVFTYVLQTCTKPSQYIPAPALELLPITSNKLAGPKVIENIPHPPIVSEVKPPVMKPQQPPILAVEAPKAPVEEPKHEAEPIKIEEHKKEVEEMPPTPPMVPTQPTPPTVPTQPTPPTPPTPAPTPPVVEPVVAIDTVKPSKTLGNMKPTQVKQKSSGNASKKGKNTPTKTGKKSVKNTKQNSKTSSAKKTPAKSSTDKKSTAAKKTTSKKAPTKA